MTTPKKPIPQPVQPKGPAPSPKTPFPKPRVLNESLGAKRDKNEMTTNLENRDRL